MVPKSYLSVGVLVLIMVALRPLSSSANFPVLLLLLIAAAVMWFAGYYGILYIRAKSFIVVTESSVRQSANMLTPLAETDFGGDPFPPMSLYLVSGGAALGTAISDKDALLVRKSSTERLGRKALLVYSPTQPVPGALLAGLAGHEHDQAVRSAFSGFVAKTGSLLHFSLLDTLHGIDSQRLREEQDFIINKHAPLMAETKRWAQAGSERFVKEIRGLASAIRKDTKSEKVGKLVYVHSMGVNPPSNETRTST